MSQIEATATAVEPCHYTLEVSIPSTKVDAEIKKVEQEIVKQVKVPGFRPGKAPKSYIRKRFGDHISEQVRERLMEKNLLDIIKEKDLQVVTSPKFVEDKEGKVEAKKDYNFTVEFDVEPTFELPNYTGLAVEKVKFDITDEAIEDNIKKITEQRASFAKVDRATESKDMIKASYTSDIELAEDALDSVKRLANTDETWMMLDPKMEMLPGCAESLLGLSEGDEKEIEVTFHEEYYEPALVGKTAKFTVKILEVHGKEAPEFDDEMAKSLGMGAETADEFRNMMREQMQLQLEELQKGGLQAQVAEQLVDGLDFDLPPTQLKDMAHNLFHQLEHDLTAEDKEKENWKEELQEKANKQASDELRLRFIIEKISKEEEIKPEPQEIMQKLQQFKQESGMSDEDFQNQYDQMQLIQGLSWNTLREKVLDKVVELGEITEVEPKTDDETEESEDSEKE